MRGLWRSAWPHLLESSVQCYPVWLLLERWSQSTVFLASQKRVLNNQSLISQFLKWMEPNCYCRLIILRWDTDSIWGCNKTPRSSLHFALKSPFASDTQRELQSPLGTMTCLLLGHQDTGPHLQSTLDRIKYLATAPTCPSLTLRRSILAQLLKKKADASGCWAKQMISIKAVGDLFILVYPFIPEIHT